MYFVFDPAVNNEDEIKRTLRKYCPRDKRKIYHPSNQPEQYITYKSDTNEFGVQRIPAEENVLNYIDTSNYGEREDRIRERMKLMKQNLPSSYIDKEKVVYTEIEPGCHFMTRFVPNEPCMIVLSNHEGAAIYFDTVIALDTTEVYCYSNRSSPGGVITHSGDIMEGLKTLMQHMKICDVKGDKERVSGCIFFHAYNLMYFRKIKQTEPNICIVDNGSNLKTMNILHFNLADSYVGDNQKAAVARFEVDLKNNLIEWYIPDKPVYFQDTDVVSSNPFSYSPSCISPPPPPRDIRPPAPHPPPTIRKRRITPLTGSDKILITQESVLNDSANVSFLNTFISTPHKYTFHNAMEYIKGGQYHQNRETVDARFALPIGGLSVLSGHQSILHLSRPPRDEEACQTLLYHLQAEYRETPTVIVVVSDQCLHGNTPHMHSKLNGIFIVMYSGKGNDIKKILNEMNTSMAATLQGPISVTLACVNNHLYFMRGVWNLQFGDRVEFENLKFSLCNSLFIPVVEKQPIYLYKSVIGYWPPRQYEEFLIDINTKCRCEKQEIKFILGQIEAIIQPDEFVKLKNAGLKLAEEESKAKGAMVKDALRVLSGDDAFKNTLTPPPAAELEKKFSNSWLNWYIFECVFKTNFFAATEEQRQFCKDAHRILKEAANTIKPFEIIYNVLEEILPTRGCYGKRNRGLDKALHVKRIDQNVQAVMDSSDQEIQTFIEENCTQEGIVAFAINFTNLRKKLAGKLDESRYEPQTYLSVFEESSLYKKQVVGIVESDQVEIFMQSKDLSLQYGNIFQFYIPILDDSIKAMENMNSYDWRASVDGGSFDKCRILLRHTVSKMLKEKLGMSHEDTLPSSGKVGTVCLWILSSLIEKLSDLCTNQSQVTDSPVKRLRAVQGLFLSFLASGSNGPLSPCYKLFGGAANHDIRIPEFIKSQEWIYTMLYSLPKSKCVVDVESVVVNYAKRMWLQYLEIEENTRDTKGLRDEELNTWEKRGLLPMVLHILSYDIEPNRLRDENEKCSRVASRADALRNYKRLVGGPRQIPYKIDTDLLVDIETRMKDNFTENILTKQKRQYRNPLTTHHIDRHELIKLYNAAMDVSFKYTTRSTLFNRLDRYLDSGKNWSEVAMVAFDNFNRKSNILLDEWIDLVLFDNEKGRKTLDEYRCMRSKMFETALKFMNPYANSSNFIFMPVLEKLLACKSIPDFKKVIAQFSVLVYTTHKHFGSYNSKETQSTCLERQRRHREFLDKPYVKFLFSFSQKQFGKSLGKSLKELGFIEM